MDNVEGSEGVGSVGRHRRTSRVERVYIILEVFLKYICNNVHNVTVTYRVVCEEVTPVSTSTGGHGRADKHVLPTYIHNKGTMRHYTDKYTVLFTPSIIQCFERALPPTDTLTRRTRFH